MERSAPENPPMPRWRLPRPRFSLLTLLLGVLFVGACGGLWWRWEPWIVTRSVTHPGIVWGVGLSPDARRCVAIYSPDSPDVPDNPFIVVEPSEHYIPCIWDIETGQQLFGE
jgi:hypothetical protein